MSRPAMLEAFDLGPAFSPAQTGPSEDWLDGHAAGFSEAQALQEQSDSALNDEIVAAVRQLAQDRAAIATVQMEQLSQMFTALLETFLPPFAQEAIVPRVVGELMTMTEQELASPILLKASPNCTAALAAVLPPDMQSTVVCREDAALSDGQVLLAADEERRLVDMDKLTRETCSALQALNASLDKEAPDE